MFNYYSYAKIKENERQDKEKEIKEKRQQEIKQNLLESKNLVGNYYTRLKDFTFKMALEPKPIKSYVSPIASTREQLLSEQDSKIIGNRGMVFKSFITEKQRVAEYLKLRKTIYNEHRLDVNRLDEAFIQGYKKFVDKTNSDIRKNIQPFMRFKPRNDLERLFEAINNNTYGKMTKEALENIIFEKMKKEELARISNQKEEDIEFEDLDFQENFYQLSDIKKHKDKLKWMKMKKEEKANELNDTLNTTLLNNSTMTVANKKSGNIKKKSKPFNKSEARLFLNEYNEKFHFKSMTKYSMFYGKLVKYT